MARFSCDINSPYGISTYEEVKNTYSWIIATLNKLPEKPSVYYEEFHFSVGDINCVVDSISEFTEHAFGAKDFKLISIMVSATYKKERVTFIGSREISVSTDNKEMLEKIITFLKDTSIEEVSEYHIENIYNNSIHIGGNTNVVVRNGKVSFGEKMTAKTFLVGIMQSIIANWVWYLLGITGFSLLTWYLAR